jgi:hypothetical protein
MKALKITLSILVLASCYYGCKKAEPEDVIPVHGPLFNNRYCEVLLADLIQGGISAEVYGSQGNCSDCPQEIWDSLDAAQIAADNNAFIAILNGIRFFVVDSAIAGSTIADSTCPYNFGGIDMRLLATLTMPISGVNENAAYIPVSVERTNIWHFNTGTRVYVLRDADGNCYIMQAYSQIVNKQLQLEDLETLGTQLALPTGWSYETFVLDNDFNLPSNNGTATVIQDELKNTYQLLHEGCLSQ